MNKDKVSSQEDLDQAIKRIRELEMSVAQKEADSLQEKSSQSRQLEKLERELIASRYERQQAQDRIRSLEGEHTMEEEGLLSTTAQVRNLEEVIAETENSNLSDSDKMSQLKNLSDELLTLKSAREEAESRALKLEQERDKSRADLNVSATRMTQLEQNIDKHKKVSHEKEEQLVELKRLESQLEESRMNSEKAQEHIEELEDERNRNYQELARSGKQIDGLVTEISNRETEMHMREEQQSQELKRLKKALKGTLDKSKDAQSRLVKLQAEQEETNEKLTKAGGNVQLLGAKLEQIKVEQKQRKHEQQNTIDPKEKQRLQSELDNLRDSLEAKQKALMSAESEKSDLEQMASDKKGDLSKLKDALNEAQMEAEEAELKRQEAEESKKQIEDALYQMRESADLMRQKEHDEFNDEGGMNLWVVLAVVAVILIGGGYYYVVSNAPEKPDPLVVETSVEENNMSQLEQSIVDESLVAVVDDKKEVPVLSIDAAIAGEKIQDKLKSGGFGPKMVVVKGDVFGMGGKGNVSRDSRPKHNVSIQSFVVGIYEVTFAQYDVFAKATGRKLPSDQNWGRGDQPVINVRWQDAQDYTAWLSIQTGQTYRLLSESEWEFMAKGGTKTAHWWGNAQGNNKANCFDCGSQWDGNSTAPVGRFKPNAFGIHNTASNVREWVADCYHENYKAAPEDQSVWDTPGCKERVVRGGAFNRPASSMTNTKRGFFDIKTYIGFLGFRVARELE